ncbi:MAG: hypothetical protein WC444_07085 [Candidatus Paceibacterota bacterium]
MTEVEKILEGLYAVGYMACEKQDSKNNLIDVENSKLQLKKLVESRKLHGSSDVEKIIDKTIDEVAKLFE